MISNLAITIGDSSTLQHTRHQLIYILISSTSQKLTNDNELVGADLDHLLAEEGATAALDKVEVGIDLVGTVDGDVELGMGVEGDEGDVEALGLLLGPDGGGDADDVLELARLEQLAHPLDSEVGGAARAQSDDHARLDVIVDGLVAHHLLELVLGKLFGHVESGRGGGVVASGRGADGGGEGRSGRGESGKTGGRGDAHLGGSFGGGTSKNAGNARMPAMTRRRRAQDVWPVATVATTYLLAYSLSSWSNPIM